MSITVYHFTSKYHVDGCLLEGLKHGRVLKDYYAGQLVGGYQWLTVSPDFVQSWCQNSTLPYDRSEYRITFDVPDEKAAQVLNWIEVCERICGAETSAILNEFGDPENWRLYLGLMSPRWITAVDRKAWSIK